MMIWNYFVLEMGHGTEQISDAVRKDAVYRGPSFKFQPAAQFTVMKAKKHKVFVQGG